MKDIAEIIASQEGAEWTTCSVCGGPATRADEARLGMCVACRFLIDINLCPICGQIECDCDDDRGMEPPVYPRYD